MIEVLREITKNINAQFLCCNRYFAELEKIVRKEMSQHSRKTAFEKKGYVIYWSYAMFGIRSCSLDFAALCDRTVVALYDNAGEPNISFQFYLTFIAPYLELIDCHPVVEVRTRLETNFEGVTQSTFPFHISQVKYLYFVRIFWLNLHIQLSPEHLTANSDVIRAHLGHVDGAPLPDESSLKLHAQLFHND